jgi:sulfur-oxidizing protein SoxX
MVSACPGKGQAAFVELKCHACHTVAGVDLPELEQGLETPVVLGGEVARLKTYGELVTSIINPSHRIAKGYAKDVVEKDGQSKMKNYNDVLTVRQLIDLVAFLEAHYELEEYEPTEYPMFP